MFNLQVSAWGKDSATVLQSRTTFESGGTNIAVEVFVPAEHEKKVGAILMLHGAGGILMDGPAIRRFARVLAANGFETFVVHYLERTGNLYVRDTAIRKNFNIWRTTVNDAVNLIGARPEVNAIGLFGYSLGGYLAIAQAAHDPRIVAMVEMAGAIDKDHVDLVKHLPPIMILHGDEDRRVPVDNAYVLEKVVRRLGIPYEMKIYAGEGHVLSTASQRDAADRAARFFRQHLR